MTNSPILLPTENLSDVVSQIVDRQGAGFTVIHAGHYLLTWNQGSASDNLEDLPPVKPAARVIANFAHETWQLACETIARFSVSDRLLLLTLVNDWQSLVPPIQSKGEQERIAAKLRREYFDRVPQLPQSHLNVLEQYGISQDRVLKREESCWLFSESRLRQEFGGTVKELLGDPARADNLGLRQYYTDNGEPVIKAAVEDGNEYCLLFCGNTNCAGEVVELLRHLYGRGVTSFVNLYPAECRQPVIAGTLLAQRLFGLAGMSVTNIAINSQNAHLGTFVVDRG